MKCGEIMGNTERQETVEDIRNRIIKAARGAFGHMPEYSDFDMVCLLASMLQRHTEERNHALSCVASQGQAISRIYVKINEALNIKPL